jgi:uncharacterized membrane protein YeaQ/YmgE (transglycosylase-associated protein family)
MDFNSLISKINQIPYAMTTLSWIGYGLASGVTAKIILPGQENMGWIRTILIGIIGAFLGGMIANYFGVDIQLGWNLLGFLAAVAGSLICLLVNRLVTRT